MKIIVLGAAGRMGREVIRQIENKRDLFTLVGAIEHSDHRHLGCDAGSLAGIVDKGVIISDVLSEKVLLGSDIWIDFSLPKGVAGHLKLAQKYGKAIVIGSTGLSSEDLVLIDELARTIPILKAANFSLGINILMRLVEVASKAVGDDFKIDIFEAHHKDKKDAPSGTALSLGAAIKGVNDTVDIDYHSLRGGDITGDHTVIISGEGERLELKHQAHSRATFACGALQAACHLNCSPPGIYSMRDVIEAKV